MPFDVLPEDPHHHDAKMLRLAKENIGRPELWVQGVPTTFRNGHPVQMCAVQSINFVCITQGDARRLIRTLAKSLPLTFRVAGFFLTSQGKVMAYNDNHWTNHTKIMTLFDLAITRLEMAHV